MIGSNVLEVFNADLKNNALVIKNYMTIVLLALTVEDECGLIKRTISVWFCPSIVGQLIRG